MTPRCQASIDELFGDCVFIPPLLEPVSSSAPAATAPVPEVQPEPEQTTTFPELPQNFTVGVYVMSRYHGISRGRWYRGKITKINSDNTVDVTYDEDLQEHHIPYHINRIRIMVVHDNEHSSTRRSTRIRNTIDVLDM